MKKLLLLIPFIVLHLWVVAQTLPLQVQLDARNQPYLVHTIGPKENFYSIGRIYNISPRVFAPYNGLDLNSSLSIGQQMRIPLNETNFWQVGARKENEVVVPVYHTARSGESIPAIARLFGTDAASVRSWNNASGDAVAAGRRLIIGFLKVDKSLSALADQGMPVRQDPPVVKTEPVVKSEPVTAKEEPKKEAPRPAENKQPERTPVTTTSTATYSGSGFFKDEFNRQTNNGRYTTNATLNGAQFKSTSGWSDGKYYILMDQVEKGAIVLVKNPANGKMVYAKVLAGVQETRPGSDARFLLSNAAAAQLGVAADNFQAEVIWGK